MRMPRSQEVHECDACNHGEQLNERLPGVVFFVEFGDEVDPRNVEEVPCGKRQQHLFNVFHMRAQQKNDHRSNECCECGEEVEKERSPFGKTAVQEHNKIPYLLRNLVEKNRNGGRNSQGDTHEVARGDEDAIQNVVRSIANKNEHPRGMDVGRAIEVMAVPPVNEFFNDKRAENTEKDNKHRIRKMRSMLGNFREEVEEDAPEQGTRGEAHKIQEHFLECAVMEQKKHDPHK